ASSSARGSEAVASFIGYSKFVYLDEHASGRSLLATDAGIVATPQKPERRAVERDEQGIRKFVKVEWKRIVKKARKRTPP
ncbi:MAG: hypothetical protein M3Q07_11660, partial [Pseudobdellovibrionaceae bacterium]|nr:hypothetical protein [Pseudobdellovibrionaceae bacterium]